jgi:hypothetical protein
MTRPARIGHVASRAADVTRSRAFHEALLREMLGPGRGDRDVPPAFGP